VDGAVYFGCRDSNLYALDARTGKQLWVLNFDGGWVSASPAVGHGKIYSGGGSDKRLRVVNAKTGEVLAQEQVGMATFASPAIAGDEVYVAFFSPELRAIDGNSGQTLWAFHLPAKEGAKPAGPVPPATDFYDDGMHAMHERLSGGVFLSSPAIGADGTIFIGSSDGVVFALH
jgi:outer membrane protein assembly factor BamB